MIGPYRGVAGYLNYVEHVVQPGDTLWAIANQYYGSGNLYYRLVAANPHRPPSPRNRRGSGYLSPVIATLTECSTSSFRWNAVAAAHRPRGGATRARGSWPSGPTSRT